MLLHASCVQIDGAGVLLLGPPGSGKSDLAFRLIDMGGLLVADDQVALTAYLGMLNASVPDTIAGCLELRGMGIISVPYCARTTLSLAVHLAERNAIERLPESAFETYCGISLPRIDLHAFDISAVLKIRYFLKQLAQEKTETRLSYG